MGDRVFYFKDQKIGDHATAMEEFMVGGQAATFDETVDGDTAAVSPRGGNAKYTIKCPTVLRFGYVSSETQREYRKRRHEFIANIAQRKTGAGALAVIEDDATDATTCTSSTPAATPATIRVAALPSGLAASDYVMITNSSTKASEIVTVISVDLTNNQFDANTTIEVGNGDAVALVELYVPNAYLQSEVSNKGAGDGHGWLVTDDMLVEFEAVDVPVYRP